LVVTIIADQARCSWRTGPHWFIEFGLRASLSSRGLGENSFCNARMGRLRRRRLELAYACVETSRCVGVHAVSKYAHSINRPTPNRAPPQPTTRRIYARTPSPLIQPDIVVPQPQNRWHRRRRGGRSLLGRRGVCGLQHEGRRRGVRIYLEKNSFPLIPASGSRFPPLPGPRGPKTPNSSMTRRDAFADRSGHFFLFFGEPLRYGRKRHQNFDVFVFFSVFYSDPKVIIFPCFFRNFPPGKNFVPSHPGLRVQVPPSRGPEGRKHLIPR